MTAHSLFFSPSSLARRIKCRGSAFLEADIVEEGPKPAADWGSFAHHIAAQCLTSKKTPEMYIDEEMYGQICDEDMAECVVQYLKDVEELKQLAPNGIVSVEQRVSLEWLGNKHVFGTSDLTIDSMYDVLVVGDLKSGAGVTVAPENNPQLYAYALMAAGEALSTYRSIFIAISQPRTQKGGRSLSIYEISPKELMDWYIDDLQPTIQAIMHGDMTLTAGDDQCRFCKACNVCPEYTRLATKLAKIDFCDRQPIAPVINDDLVQQVYPHLPILKEWIKRIEGHAFNMACQDTLDGFKLVAGRRSRTWSDERAAVETMRDRGVDPFEHKILSPAKAEKAMKREKSLLKDFIAVLNGKPCIVPVANIRKAISTSEIEFKTL